MAGGGPDKYLHSSVGESVVKTMSTKPTEIGTSDTFFSVKYTLSHYNKKEHLPSHKEELLNFVYWGFRARRQRGHFETMS